eukprot:scaffold74178_cov21-Prasinocladus_malaysianus.AAC.1
MINEWTFAYAKVDSFKSLWSFDSTIWSLVLEEVTPSGTLLKLSQFYGHELCLCRPLDVCELRQAVSTIYNRRSDHTYIDCRRPAH